MAVSNVAIREFWCGVVVPNRGGIQNVSVAGRAFVAFTGPASDPSAGELVEWTQDELAGVLRAVADREFCPGDGGSRVTKVIRRGDPLTEDEEARGRLPLAGVLYVVPYTGQRRALDALPPPLLAPESAS